MESALRGSTAGGATTSADAIAAQLLALLSGHQLAAAAALAAATGNVRLATLLAQAGTKAVGAAELAEQLRVWEESGCERHISAALRRVYQLLAGGVDEVMPSMQLDWRRALGVHLWYGCQPAASVADAVAAYTAAVEAGAAPPPLPLYAEMAASGSSSASGSSASGGSFDVAFELLRLYAVASDPDAVAHSPVVLQPLLARLLRWGGVSVAGLRMHRITVCSPGAWHTQLPDRAAASPCAGPLGSPLTHWTTPSAGTCCRCWQRWMLCRLRWQRCRKVRASCSAGLRVLTPRPVLQAR